MQQKIWKETKLISLNGLIVFFIYFVAGIAALKIFTKGHAQLYTLYIADILIVVSYLCGVKWIERRTPRELSLHSALPALVGGVFITIGLNSISHLISWVAGMYQVQGWGTFTVQNVYWLFLALGASITEEILFRGILVRFFSSFCGTWAAIFISSLLFSASHFTNPSYTPAVYTVTFLAGVMLAGAYVATGRLWLSIGLHFGFDFSQGIIFSFFIKGVDVKGYSAWFLNLPTFLVIVPAALYFLWRIHKYRLARPPIWK
jgi:membrane protease YdiL (CAAX protease family)